MPTSNLRILRLSDVKGRTGLPRSSIYAKISEDRFPKSISLGGGRSVGWIESEIDEWITEQVKLSRQTQEG